MNIREVEPFLFFDEIQSHQSLFFTLRGKTVHREEVQNNMRIGLGNIGDVFRQFIDIQILFYQFLQPRRSTLQGQSHMHHSRFDHQVDIVAGQNIAPQA